MDLPPRPELFDFHGVPMTRYFTDNWENIQKFQARPDDILIASYPKAGSTWISYVLDLLHFGQTSTVIQARVPNLEVSIVNTNKDSHSHSSWTVSTMFPWRDHPVRGTELVENLDTSPRLMKTHLSVQFLPRSFWEQNCRPGDWSSYLQRFMEGKMLFGSWYDHVNDWWKKRESSSKLHYIFYEDLVEDTGREIDKLCCFLGLSPSAEEKEIIKDKVQFDQMKTNKLVNLSTFRWMDSKISPFMRKGKVGDWKNDFTVAQNEEFDEDYKRQMKDSTLQFRTENKTAST